jgi:signal recognition particle receptor subunit beta
VAVFDSTRDVITVRLVYDGPPHAGKTTSLRSLGRSLLRDVHTPLEAAGRTMFFDWMEYTGGRFDGHQIRCQIVSVPGQPNLAPRRKALLLSADAVIFVADTGNRASASRSAEYVAGLSRLLQSSNVPVGLVVQANKRDLPSAMPLADVRSALALPSAGVAVTESVAHEGVGVRETFVLAVRLALDRVRDLVARGLLPHGRPEIDNAEELLASLATTVPAHVLPSDVDSGPEADALPAVATTARSSAVSPRLPDNRVPSGAIWPAVDGRIVLHESARATFRLRQEGDGSWVAASAEWTMRSDAGDEFTDLEAGRSAVVGWARAHAGRIGLLSSGRCIVVAEAGPTQWRLWQIVRTWPSLRDGVVALARSGEATDLLNALVASARTLAAAMASRMAAGLPMSLSSVAHGAEGPMFIAFMPSRALLASESDSMPAIIVTELERQLRAFCDGELSGRRTELRRLLALGWAAQKNDEWARRVARVVATL